MIIISHTNSKGGSLKTLEAYYNHFESKSIPWNLLVYADGSTEETNADIGQNYEIGLVGDFDEDEPTSGHYKGAISAVYEVWTSLGKQEVTYKGKVDPGPLFDRSQFEAYLGRGFVTIEVGSDFREDGLYEVYKRGSQKNFDGCPNGALVDLVDAREWEKITGKRFEAERGIFWYRPCESRGRFNYMKNNLRFLDRKTVKYRCILDTEKLGSDKAIFEDWNAQLPVKSVSLADLKINPSGLLKSEQNAFLIDRRVWNHTTPNVRVGTGETYLNYVQLDADVGTFVGSGSATVTQTSNVTASAFCAFAQGSLGDWDITIDGQGFTSQTSASANIVLGFANLPGNVPIKIKNMHMIRGRNADSVIRGLFAYVDNNGVPYILYNCFFDCGGYQGSGIQSDEDINPDQSIYNCFLWGTHDYGIYYGGSATGTFVKHNTIIGDGTGIGLKAINAIEGVENNIVMGGDTDYSLDFSPFVENANGSSDATGDLGFRNLTTSQFQNTANPVLDTYYQPNAGDTVLIDGTTQTNSILLTDIYGNPRSSDKWYIGAKMGEFITLKARQERNKFNFGFGFDF